MTILGSREGSRAQAFEDLRLNERNQSTWLQMLKESVRSFISPFKDNLMSSFTKSLHDSLKEET